ncbi:E3 ubiquitin-protein ligase rnf152 isoform X1 [Synchiropus splendidus]|uniref:E3 ubiquitin-protein ligase rnf152 isoform X1 n=2 Tax=Synchiropus splendidus TaxID=270530 RepID=UPI00237E4143|nr:E3 ubiquitin-protein ligase rnf152 isoform X1 [Synchiropus splendidus]
MSGAGSHLSPGSISRKQCSEVTGAAGLIMETVCQDSLLECQICFHCYSARRRPKLLDCRHTCCSVCLSQLRGSQKELRCPWCRAVTTLAPGLSVAQLPDDPDVVTVLAVPHVSERTPVFIRLPSSGCYMLPLHAAKESACRFLPGGQQKGVAVVAVPDPPGLEESGLEEVERQAGGPGGARKGSTWSGVCTVILVACVLLFLLAIVLHNMSCISKRFTVISCG